MHEEWPEYYRIALARSDEGKGPEEVVKKASRIADLSVIEHRRREGGRGSDMHLRSIIRMLVSGAPHGISRAKLRAQVIEHAKAIVDAEITAAREDGEIDSPRNGHRGTDDEIFTEEIPF